MSYSDVEEFYDLCYPFLLKHEAENNLIFGILDTLKQNMYAYSTQDKPHFNIVFEEEKIKLVAIRTPPYNQILSYTDDLRSIPFLIEILSTQDKEIPGVHGIKEAAIKFAQLWASKHNKTFTLQMNERIYRLESINPRTLGNRTFEVAKQTDQGLLLEWMKQFLLEALPHSSEEAIKNSQKRMKEAITQENVYVLKIKDQIVSMAKKAGMTPSGQIINAVYTPPALRRKGYATEVVAKLCQTILNKGKKYCFLFTNLANPTSNSIYMQIGFKPVIDVDEYHFED